MCQVATGDSAQEKAFPFSSFVALCCSYPCRFPHWRLLWFETRHCRREVGDVDNSKVNTLGTRRIVVVARDPYPPESIPETCQEFEGGVKPLFLEKALSVAKLAGRGGAIVSWTFKKARKSCRYTRGGLLKVAALESFARLKKTSARIDSLPDPSGFRHERRRIFCPLIKL